MALRLEKYPFVHTDAGRSRSSYPNQGGDCTVRALALSADLDYDTCYEYLKDVVGRKNNCGADFPGKLWIAKHVDYELGPNSHLYSTKKYVEHHVDEHTYRFFWVPFPIKKGRKRMTYPEFVKSFGKGRYITREARHVSVVIDGVVYDEVEQREGRAIYGCWKVVKAK